MKQTFFQTKYLLGLLILLFLAIIIPTAIFATSGYLKPSYSALTVSTTPGVIASSTTVINVNGYNVSGDSFIFFNLSANTYLIPNNTASEFAALYSHVPNYVSVAICGDGICTIETVAGQNISYYFDI
jgi:hypothetical protein